jgi:beta-glucosidase
MCILKLIFCHRHGLSYTTFDISKPIITSNKVTVTVTNTGKTAGAEVVQVYIAADPSTSSIARPKKELKGFAKVFLEAGASTEAVIDLDRHATAFWDEILNAWVNEKGNYKVLVGKSSANIVAEGDFVLEETTTWVGL